MTVIKDFARAFWQGMGDRENNLQAVREAAIGMTVLWCLAGVVVAAQHINP